MIVAKFGGAVLRDAAGVRRVCHEIKSLPRPLLVVVSATASTTNRLEQLADAAVRSSEQARTHYDAIVADHRAIAAELLDPPALESWNAAVDPMFVRLAEVIDGLAIVGELSPRTLDLVVHFGERLSSSIVAVTLEQADVQLERISALDLVITDDVHRFARPNLGLVASRVDERLRPALEGNRVVLTEGYIARGTSGEVTTMGRESSDYTATMLGGMLGASEVRLYTRVQGIMTADPAIFSSARTITSMGYAMARTLSELGVKVLHPRTVGPLEQASIPLVITDLDGNATTIEHDARQGECSIALLPEVRIATFGLRSVRADITLLLSRIAEHVPVLWHHQFRHTLQVVTAEDISDELLLQATSGFTLLRSIPAAVVSIVSPSGITSNEYQMLFNALEGHVPLALQATVDDLALSAAVDRRDAAEFAKRMVR